MNNPLTRGLGRTTTTLGLFLPVFALAAATAMASCSSTTTLYTTAATDGGADEGGVSAEGGDAPLPPLTADVCASYIACVGTVSPPLLDGVIRAYGPSGSCFSAQNSEACSENCMAGILMLGSARTTEAGWKNDGCNACNTTPDCFHVGEVCASGACVAYAQDATASRDQMACDFDMNQCGTGKFCSERRDSAAAAYGEGNCAAEAPQGKSCSESDTAPRGFECVDLSYSEYGPGRRYLAVCQRGGDCPQSTTCLRGGSGGDPFGHCVGPRKQQ